MRFLRDRGLNVQNSRIGFRVYVSAGGAQLGVRGFGCGASGVKVLSSGPSICFFAFFV